MTITRKQELALLKLAARVRKVRMHEGNEYAVRVLMVPQWRTVPGTVSLTAGSAELYERLVRVLKRILPDVKLHFEHGTGWHYLDRTPYFYGEFSYNTSEK